DAGWMCAPLFCPEKVLEALGLDPALVPHALLTLGYAEGDPPKRRGRRPLEELVVYRDCDRVRPMIEGLPGDSGVLPA
nr:hypothetical protein [Actinomycetota bacterium]